MLGKELMCVQLDPAYPSVIKRGKDGGPRFLLAGHVVIVAGLCSPLEAPEIQRTARILNTPAMDYIYIL